MPGSYLWVCSLWQPFSPLHTQNSVHAAFASLHVHLPDAHALVSLLHMHFIRRSSSGGAMIAPFGRSTGFSLEDPSTFFHPFFRQSNCGGSGSVQLFHMASCKCVLPQFSLKASSVGGRVHRGGWSNKHFEIFLLHNSFLASVMLPQWLMLQHASMNFSPSLYIALQSSTELSQRDVKDIPPNRNMTHVYINRK